MKILLAGATPEQTGLLRAKFPAEEFESAEPPTVQAAHADALIGFSRGAFDRVFTADTIRTCQTWKWVHAPGAGIDTYLFEDLALPEAGFVLTNGKIIQGPEVADHAVALLLALTRRIHFVLQGLQPQAFARPIELRDKRALIIGAGGVGLCIAERLRGFGMIVDAVTESNVPLIGAIRRRYLADELMDALPGSNVVIMAAPLTRMSQRVISSAALGRMPADGYFINVSRGRTVDTAALLAALERGHLAGVGLDVTDPEPLPADHPLRKVPRVLVTPHIAGMSDQLSVRIMDLIEENVRRFTAGLPLINEVDKRVNF